MKIIIALLLALNLNISVYPATVVETYDGIVVVETADGNIWEYYGETSETEVYVVFHGNEIINAF